MILIDNQKFACSACINGHRSSSCHHTERPLFEIKKKGRPVSQCERCRELRKTRSYHSKCLCDKPPGTAEPEPSADKTPGNKRKKVARTAPKIPTLPNGIKDLLDTSKSSDSEQQEESRKKPKTSVNSCKCGCDSTKRCRCGGGDLLASIQAQGDGDTCCVGTSHSGISAKRLTPSRRVLPQPKKSTQTPQRASPAEATPQTPSNSCCAPKTPREERFLAQYRDVPIVIKPLSLPPDSASPGLLPSIATWTTPLPSLHTHSTTTMDSCGCGDGCACAGCAEHRGAVAAAAAVAAGHHSCPDRCGTCQDRALTDMHITTLGGMGSDDSSVESLLARAIAKLPPPPPGKLSVFQSATGGDRVALVVLPRLDATGESRSKTSCCTRPSASTLDRSFGSVSPQLQSLFPPFPQLNSAKNTARSRRQIRSPSPSDDELTDADAEGEIDPENESVDNPVPSAASNDWALAQFDVDVDLELELAADAIDQTH